MFSRFALTSVGSLSGWSTHGRHRGYRIKPKGRKRTASPASIRRKARNAGARKAARR